MLREIQQVRQIQGEASRRWFSSHEMDLIVWHQAGCLTGFQLCYDKNAEEKALTWTHSSGLLHEQVDNGESRRGHYKASPVLFRDGEYNLNKIRTAFISQSQNIADDVREFVLQQLV